MEASYRSFASILVPEVRQNLGSVVLGFARAPLSLMSNQFSWIFGSGSVGIWDLLAPCWSRQSHPRNLDSQSSHVLCKMAKCVCKCMNRGFSLHRWCQSLELEEITYWKKKKQFACEIILFIALFRVLENEAFLFSGWMENRYLPTYLYPPNSTIILWPFRQKLHVNTLLCFAPSLSSSLRLWIWR